MATVVFRDWVNAVLRGNSDLSAEVVESVVIDVAFEVTVNLSIAAETKTQRVSGPDEGPSIRLAEEMALAKESPMGPVNRALRQSPFLYLGPGGRHAVPGWVFSETKTRSCLDCGETGKVGCGACGRRGKINCGSCEGRGYLSCGACGGRGYRMETRSAHDSAGKFYYYEERVNCYCVSGRNRCGTCSGNKQVTCPRCTGTGSVTCQPCQGRGSISDCTTKTYFARFEASVSLRHVDAEAVAFVQRHWVELTRRRRTPVQGFEQSVDRSDGAVWNLSGTVRLERQQLGVGERRVKVLGSPPESGGVASAVLEIDPFLGDALGVDGWEVTRGRGRLLLENASMRLVQEGVATWDASGGKAALRSAALESKLLEQYGPALSAKQRATIVTLVGKGFGQLRGERLRSSWFVFSLASILAGLGVVLVLLLVMSAWPRPDPAVGRAIGLGTLGGCALWFGLGWFRARQSLSKLGRSLGLKEKLSAKQGSWGTTGILFSFVGFNVGALVGIVAAMAMIGYTSWLSDELREEILSSASFNERIPASREVALTRGLPRRSKPSESSRALTEIPAGARFEVVGAPIREWTPIRFEGRFGWARLMDGE